MAPPMAAEVLGRPPFTVADLIGELVWPNGIAVGLVESAGGVLSPIAEDGDGVTLGGHPGPDRGDGAGRHGHRGLRHPHPCGAHQWRAFPRRGHA